MDFDDDLPQSERLDADDDPPRIGPYVLLDLLGRGGMADAYLAALGSSFGALKLVVLKCVRARDGEGGELARMFADEASLACRLTHPNVVTCYEAGEVDGEMFLAMEYLDGQPLSRVLRLLEIAGASVPPRVAARIVSDVLRGLHYAHTLVGFDGAPLSIVHRDVSPANIFVTYGGVTKVLDFGIAKWALAANRTGTGLVKGKLAYMAPEQALALPVDARADLYSAGVTLWELLAGRRLHGGVRSTALMFRVLQEPIPRLSEVGIEVPSRLEEVVARAVDRDSSARFVSAAHFGEALEAALASVGGLATPGEVGAFAAGLFASEREQRSRALSVQLRNLARAQALAAAVEAPISAASDTPTVLDARAAAAVVARPARVALATAAGALAVALTVLVLALFSSHTSVPRSHAGTPPLGPADAAPDHR